MTDLIDGQFFIPIPWVPDIVHAYKFGICSLCKEEKQKNPKFDTKGCPHCMKETKITSWSSCMDK